MHDRHGAMQSGVAIATSQRARASVKGWASTRLEMTMMMMMMLLLLDLEPIQFFPHVHATCLSGVWVLVLITPMHEEEFMCAARPSLFLRSSRCCRTTNSITHFEPPLSPPGLGQDQAPEI